MAKQSGKRGIKKAVDLRYRRYIDNAPKVTAKGFGSLAEKIIEIARSHGVPIKEDAALIEVLSRLDLNEEIPPEVYVLVAEILAFVYTLNKKWGEFHG